MSLGMSFQTATQGSDPIFTWPDYFPQYDAATQQVVKNSAQVVKAKTDGIVSFSDWLNRKFPDLYKQVMTARPDLLIPEFALAGMAGLADNTTSTATPGGTTDTSQPPATDWGTTISNLLQPLLGVWQQKQLIDINIKRAEQGLQPVDSTAVSPTVNVQPSPALVQPIKQMGTTITLGLLGLGVLLLISKKRR